MFRVTWTLVIGNVAPGVEQKSVFQIGMFNCSYSIARSYTDG